MVLIFSTINLTEYEYVVWPLFPSEYVLDRHHESGILSSKIM
jgi:hypothetical protein